MPKNLIQFFVEFATSTSPNLHLSFTALSFFFFFIISALLQISVVPFFLQRFCNFFNTTLFLTAPSSSSCASLSPHKLPRVVLEAVVVYFDHLNPLTIWVSFLHTLRLAPHLDSVRVQPTFWGGLSNQDSNTSCVFTWIWISLSRISTEFKAMCKQGSRHSCDDSIVDEREINQIISELDRYQVNVAAL